MSFCDPEFRQEFPPSTLSLEDHWEVSIHKQRCCRPPLPLTHGDNWECIIHRSVAAKYHAASDSHFLKQTPQEANKGIDLL